MTENFVDQDVKPQTNIQTKALLPQLTVLWRINKIRLKLPFLCRVSDILELIRFIIYVSH